MPGYAKIVAPFDGLVTARDTDVGALINSGASNGPALFVISDIKRLRVYVNVPQNYAPAVKVGNKAVITVPEYPGRAFPATVEASSQAVEAASGTTRIQLVVDNADRALMPGAYAGVRLDLSATTQPLNIPASALLFDKAGLRVATVGPDDPRPVQACDRRARSRHGDRDRNGPDAHRPHHRHASRWPRRWRPGPCPERRRADHPGCGIGAERGGWAELEPDAAECLIVACQQSDRIIARDEPR